MKWKIVISLLLAVFAISCSKGSEINDGPQTAASSQTSDASLRLAPRRAFGIRTAMIRTQALTHHVRAVAVVTPDARQPQRLWITADVYADEVGLLRVGQSVEVSMASAPRINFRSSVRYVSPTIDENTRTAKVRIDTGKEARLLKAGLFALVDLDGSLGECLALPGDALIEVGPHKMVYVQVGESTYEPLEVQLGRVADGYYEVLGGLSAGERVVTSPSFLRASVTRVNATSDGAQVQ